MNIDDLKKPIPALDYDDSPYLSGLNEGQAIGWNEAIDYLASRGYLPSVQRIDGLDEAIERVVSDCQYVQSECGVSDEDIDPYDLVVEAARAYAKLQDGETQQPADAVVPDSDMFPDEVWLAKGEHSQPLYQVKRTKFSKVKYVRADKALTAQQPPKNGD